MAHPFDTLVEFISDIENALEKEDWDEIARLDSSAQSIVSACTRINLDESDKAKLSQQLEKLNIIYNRLSAENLGRRSALGDELKKLHKEQNAINQYIQSSGY